MSYPLSDVDDDNISDDESLLEDAWESYEESKDPDQDKVWADEIYNSNHRHDQ